MDDVKKLLAGSGLDQLLAESGLDQKRQLDVVCSVLQVAGKLALDQSKGQAGGDFLRLLIELIKLFLPILLDLLKPKT